MRAHLFLFAALISSGWMETGSCQRVSLFLGALEQVLQQRLDNPSFYHSHEEDSMPRFSMLLGPLNTLFFHPRVNGRFQDEPSQNSRKNNHLACLLFRLEIGLNGPGNMI